jgi:hypothetical protein
MRTTIELPDELLTQVRALAALSGVSLRQFFTDAIKEKVNPQPRKVRRPPPVFGSEGAPVIGVLTAEQIDEVMFG